MVQTKMYNMTTCFDVSEQMVYNTYQYELFNKSLHSEMEEKRNSALFQNLGMA